MDEARAREQELSRHEIQEDESAMALQQVGRPWLRCAVLCFRQCRACLLLRRACFGCQLTSSLWLMK